MPSADITRKPRKAVAEIVANIPSQLDVRPDEAVQTLDEFLEFLEHLEDIFGRDLCPRPPTVGTRFLL
jgi:hypothetical protein